MSSQGTTEKKASVSKRCLSSLELLRKIVAVTSQPDHDSSWITNGQVQEELDRLSLFIGNMGALHRPQSLLSIESRLREAHDVLLHITNLLDDLGDAAEELYEIVSGGRGDIIRTSDELKEDCKQISEADELRKEIRETVTRLFRVSVVIRQAAPTDVFVKALSRDRYRFDGQSDINHVSDKYCKLAKNEYAWLRRRLGRAITDRRCYLSYIQDHHDKLEGTLGHDDNVDDSAVKVDAPPSQAVLETATNPSRITKATTFAPAQYEPQLLATENVGMEEEEEEEEDNHSYTTVSRSIDEDNESSTAVRIPKLNDLRNGSRGEFECPFCFRIKTFKKEHTWRKHVFADLRSYICTFPDCDAPYFKDINEWFSHEMRMHRVDYKCPICPNATFSKKTAYTAHLEQKHADLVHEGKGIDQSMIDLARKPLAHIRASDCPCCYDWVDRLRTRMIQHGQPGADNALNVVPTVFKRHLASHLEQLALFAIPISVMANDDSDDQILSDDQTSGGTQDTETWRVQACCEALFLADPEHDREMMLSQKEAIGSYTFEWITSRAEYKSWYGVPVWDYFSDDGQSGQSIVMKRLLWVSGRAGTGKTTFSISLIRNLESGFESGLEIIFFFCRGYDEKRNTVIAVLRGLIYQIIKKQQWLGKHALKYFKTPEDTQQTLQSFEALWNIFSELVMNRERRNMFCVLDGLDECEEHDLGDFLSRIAELLTSENTRRIPRFRMLITSRPMLVGSVLATCPKISLDHADQSSPPLGGTKDASSDNSGDSPDKKEQHDGFDFDFDAFKYAAATAGSATTDDAWGFGTAKSKSKKKGSTALLDKSVPETTAEPEEEFLDSQG